VRTATIWKLGIAYHLQGDRAAARQAYSEAIAISQSSGNIMITLSGMLGLGNIQELDNQLHLAEQTYQRMLQLIGDSPNPAACEAHLGLARICYEWNDLDAAQHHAQLSLQLAQQLENLDRVASCETFFARLKLALDEVEGAATCLIRAETLVHQHHFVYQTPEVAAVRVLLLLRQGNLTAAAELVQAHNLPLSQARVLLAQGDTSAALDILESWQEHVEAKNWQDERLKVMVLESVALYAHGDVDSAVHLLSDALSLAEPEGFIRVFVDEDTAELLSEVTVMPQYVGKLLAAFDTDDHIDLVLAQPLIEPLSDRELEVLHLIAQGLSNQEISERLFLALNTVKGHNQKIFGKLQVERRTEAVARARELGLL
jgi:LuxR family maltose regulon positive regulatory protein